MYQQAVRRLDLSCRSKRLRIESDLLVVADEEPLARCGITQLTVRTHLGAGGGNYLADILAAKHSG